MIKVTAEYRNGLVKDMMMDKDTWFTFVQPALEADNEVVNYRAEAQR